MTVKQFIPLGGLIIFICTVLFAAWITEWQEAGWWIGILIGGPGSVAYVVLGLVKLNKAEKTS